MLRKKLLFELYFYLYAGDGFMFLMNIRCSWALRVGNCRGIHAHDPCILAPDDWILPHVCMIIENHVLTVFQCLWSDTSVVAALRRHEATWVEIYE